MKQAQSEDIHPQEGLALGLTILFAILRTVQVFSRVPGSTGTWFLGFYLLGGIALMGYWCEMNNEHPAWHYLIAVSLSWLLVHSFLRMLNSARGIVLHSHEEGIGVLVFCFPNASLWTIGIVSDLVVSALMGIALGALGLTALSNWFISTIGWRLIAECYLSARYRYHRQQRDDKRIEAQVWSESSLRR